MNPPERVESVTLPDGRRLAYVCHGDKGGIPLLLCHGTPGSRRCITTAMAEQASQQGFRLIIPDRPGYGLSDPHPGSGLLDWPRDVDHLLAGLDIPHAHLLGYSLGGMHALACAWALPYRFKSLTLVESLAPNLLDDSLANIMSPTVRNILMLASSQPLEFRTAMTALTEDVDQTLDLMLSSYSLQDQATGTDPAIRAAHRTAIQDTVSRGEGALVEDYLNSVASWGFSLTDIALPTRIWQGLEDINTPPALAEYLAAQLPNAQLTRLSGEGHLAFYSSWKAICAGIKTIAEPG
ncbi:MAG: alpha/beta hydrolase [Pseudomonadota bacterium]